MLENKELIISLVLIIAFVIVVTYLLTKFLINNKADKMYSAWRDLKKDNRRLLKKEKAFDSLVERHSATISVIKNSKSRDEILIKLEGKI